MTATMVLTESSVASAARTRASHTSCSLEKPAPSALSRRDEVHSLADDPVERAPFRRRDAARRVENALLGDRCLHEPRAKGPPVFVASPPVELVIADRQEHGRLPEGVQLPLDEVVPRAAEVLGRLEAVELVRRPALAVVRGVPSLQDVAIDGVHPPEVPEVKVELGSRADGLSFDRPRDLGHDEVAAVAGISRDGERPGDRRRGLEEDDGSQHGQDDARDEVFHRAFSRPGFNVPLPLRSSGCAS